MIPAGVVSIFQMPFIVVLAAWMTLRMVNFVPMFVGGSGAAAGGAAKTGWGAGPVATAPALAWATAAFWAVSPSELVVWCGQENRGNCVATTELVA
jgi:hypothetical protein